MPHDGRVIRQAAEFVGFDAIFLGPLIGVGRVIEMHGARGALNVVLAQRIRATERVNLRGRAIHHEVLQIEREHFGLLLRLRRNE